MQNIIIDGLQIIEGNDEPRGRDYIAVYDKIDNMVLKDVYVMKAGEPNGTLVKFGKKGRIGNFLARDIYAKGLERMVSDIDHIDEYMAKTDISYVSEIKDAAK